MSWFLATQVVKAFEDHQADRVVAEVNQGGDMVRTVLRQSAPYLPVIDVRASRGKIVRAEPIAALYEQKRVHHVGRMDALEKQMCEMVYGQSGLKKSPDRVDALVWALTYLSGQDGSPTVRRL
jgi:phage terminase large subunit-like protein